MAGKLGKFQMQSFEGWFDKVSKANHLGALFTEQPQAATDLMVRLLAWYGGGKTLDTFLSQFPTKTFATDDEYTWDVVGDAMKNIPLVEARDVDGNPVTDVTAGNLGKNGTPFYLVFPEEYFADQEEIVGELNEAYILRILGDARNEGTNAVYKVELMGGNTEGMPVSELVMGKRFSVEYAAVESELSRKAGGIRHASTVAMRNEFSTIRIHHKVSGKMLNRKLTKKWAVGVPFVDPVAGGKEQVFTMWMHEVQWELEQQWNRYKNNLLAYARSNRNLNGEYLNIGKSGEVIRMGAGLYEQMEYANTDPYNTFSLKHFLDNISDVTTNLPFEQRQVVVRTGEGGAIQFSEHALREGSGWSPITYQYDASELGTMVPVQNKVAPRGGAYKLTIPQATELVAPNGLYVKIEVDPRYDDKVRNKIIMPGTNRPAMSYRYDIFDIGTMDQPNIFKVAVEGEEGDYTSYEWGLRNPFTGQKGNPNASHDEDSATIHKMTTTGVCVLDPTRTMSYIPSVIVG